MWWLTLLASLGVTSVIPLLPLYARDQGADLQAIGWMAAAYLATNLVFLYGAGRLSDWLGRRPLMAVGMLTYAACSLGFLLWPSALGFIVLRGIEGIAAACFLPAALAYVADRYPISERGLRISQLAVAENLGLLLGPAFGGAVKTALGMGVLFACLAVMCLIGTALVFRLPVPAKREADVPVPPGAQGTPSQAPEQPPEATEASTVTRTGGPLMRKGPGLWHSVRPYLFVGISCRAAAAGFALGSYLTVWPLFMAALGASDWDVSFSWTVFAVPSLFLGPFAGRLIDRVGGGRPLLWGALFSGCVVCSYAFCADVSTLLAFCALEGVGFAFAYPAANTLMVQAAPEAMRGRMIGAVTAIRTLGTLIGALLTPIWYAHGARPTFLGVGVVLLVGAATLALCLALDRRQTVSAEGAGAPV